LNDSTVSL